MSVGRHPTEPSAPLPHGAAGGPPADETQDGRRVGDCGRARDPFGQSGAIGSIARDLLCLR